MRLFLFTAAILFSGALTGCRREYIKDVNKELLGLDSAAIEGWEVLPPKGRGATYSVMRSQDGWMIIPANGRRAAIEQEYALRGVRHLAGLRANSEIKTDPANWDTMLVDDQGTRVRVQARDKKVEFIVGKMFFAGNVKATYYVRLAGDDKVYTVPLYLEGSIMAGPEKARRKNLLPVSVAAINEIKFLSPEGLNYTLRHDPARGEWMVGNTPAVSAKVLEYLRLLHELDIKNFGEAPSRGAERSILVSTAQGTQFQVRASRKDNDTWIIASPENPGNYLEAAPAAIEKLFPARSYFLTP